MKASLISLLNQRNSIYIILITIDSLLVPSRKNYAILVRRSCYNQSKRVLPRGLSRNFSWFIAKVKRLISFKIKVVKNRVPLFRKQLNNEIRHSIESLPPMISRIIIDSFHTHLLSTVTNWLQEVSMPTPSLYPSFSALDEDIWKATKVKQKYVWTTSLDIDAISAHLRWDLWWYSGSIKCRSR